ncbi:hypothetical protein N9L19_01085 [bacterium]|nr:hypothetical protein [bacterium]
MKYILLREGGRAKAKASDYRRGASEGQDSERGREEFAEYIVAGGQLLAWDNGRDSRTASGQVVLPPCAADASPALDPAIVSAPLPPALLKCMPPLPPPPRHHEPRRPEAPPAVKCGAFWFHRGPGHHVDVQCGGETDEGTAKAR